MSFTNYFDLFIILYSCMLKLLFIAYKVYCSNISLHSCFIKNNTNDSIILNYILFILRIKCILYWPTKYLYHPQSLNKMVLTNLSINYYILKYYIILYKKLENGINVTKKTLYSSFLNCLFILHLILLLTNF